MKMKLAYNIGLYRGHVIDRTVDGYVIFEDDKVVYYTETNTDDAAIRYRAMEVIDRIHRDRRKEVDVSIQRVDAQVYRHDNY
jgi:exosome complex RNA-binding protein Csl4